MSNYGLFRAFDEAGLRYETTQVGDRFVYACMREHGYSLGGEQSGHIIFGDLETTGDGIMTSFRVMEAVRAERESLATLARPVTLYPQRLENVRVKDREAAMAAPELAEATKRAEALLAGNGRVLVRPSGTEPLVRILAEAPDEELCRKATSVVAEALAPYREEDAES